MKPGKLSDLMLLKLNSDTVKKYKETHKVEAKFTHGQISNLITVDLEELMNPEDADNANDEFVEDLPHSALDTISQLLKMHLDEKWYTFLSEYPPESL